MKSLFLILFLSVMFISCKDDNNLREITDDEKIFEYIGLKDKANVIEAQEKFGILMGVLIDRLFK